MEKAIIIKQNQAVEEDQPTQEFVMYDRRDIGGNPMAVVDWEIDSIMRELDER